ncbi:MAG: acetoin utilization protein AcuC, partial [Chloroflexi bacterium]|nr:acetoin utilization protein AcuC [Chloroflexota bacterium]
MSLTVVYDEAVRNYDFGPGHPFRGDRYAAFMRLFRDKVANFQLVKPRHATNEELFLVHDEHYVRFLQDAAWSSRLPHHMFLTEDTPLQPGLEEAGRLVVGTSLLAAELVWEGKSSCAVSVGGGLHHAKAAHGAGFCIYNDVAVCVRNILQEHHLERILVLDTDAHAGDGTCQLFYDDPRVLFIDLHQDPRTLYPGTGFAHEIGSGKGTGYTVNIPLPPGASDDAYELVLDEVFAPLAREFAPQ